MIEVTKDTDIDRKINQVIEMAWNFGHACSDDGISKMSEHGDSHIEYLRMKLDDAKDELYLMMLERMK
jgi:hypothetical protein